MGDVTSGGGFPAANFFRSRRCSD